MRTRSEAGEEACSFLGERVWRCLKRRELRWINIKLSWKAAREPK